MEKKYSLIISIVLLLFSLSLLSADNITEFEKLLNVENLSKQDKKILTEIAETFVTLDPAYVVDLFLKDIAIVINGESRDNFKRNYNRAIDQIQHKIHDELLKEYMLEKDLDLAYNNLVNRINLDLNISVLSVEAKNSLIDLRQFALHILKNEKSYFYNNIFDYYNKREDIIYEEYYNKLYRKKDLKFISSSMNEDIDIKQTIFELTRNKYRLKNIDQLGSSKQKSSVVIGAVPFPRRTLTYSHVIANDEKFSAKVKVSFLGANIDAGPSVDFKRRYIISTKLTASGDEPIIINDEVLNKRILNHSLERRIVVSCTVRAEAMHELNGSVSLSLFGSGATISKGEWSKLAVSIDQARYHAPLENDGGERTSFADLALKCKNDLIKYDKKTLDLELMLTAKELVYHNRLNQCVLDEHCLSWEKQFSLAIRRVTETKCELSNTSGAPFNYCRFRSIKNGSCSYYNENGKRITPGYFEYPCLEGLHCRITNWGGWISHTQAQCL